jgi:hypothetical protein
LVAAVTGGLALFARTDIGHGATAAANCGGVNRWDVTLIPLCRTGSTNGRAQLHGTATFRGVGFFDLLHGSTQHGVAPNEVELHTALRFQATC